MGEGLVRHHDDTGRGSLVLYTGAQIMRNFLESGIESQAGMGDHPIPLSCPHLGPYRSCRLS